MLDLVDDVAAGAERLVAVRGADANPHRQLADPQLPDAVHAQRVRHAEALARLGDDALALAHGERLEGLVFEPPHALALVVIAHPALEGGVAAAGRVGELGAQCRHVERLCG